MDRRVYRDDRTGRTGDLGRTPVQERIMTGEEARARSTDDRPPL
jgi:hypothetical protein